MPTSCFFDLGEDPAPHPPRTRSRSPPEPRPARPRASALKSTVTKSPFWAGRPSTGGARRTRCAAGPSARRLPRRHLGAGSLGTSTPLYSPSTTSGMTVTRGREAEGLAQFGHLVSSTLDLGPIDRVEARVRWPPMRTSRPWRPRRRRSRMALVAQALPHHDERHLALAGSRECALPRTSFFRLGIESFLQLFAGNLDRKLDRVSIALTEGRLHILPFLD